MLAQRIQLESACIPFFNIIKGEVGCAGSPQNPSVRYLKMAGSPYFGADPPGIPSGSPSAPGQIPSIPFVFFKCNDNIFTHHSLRQTHSFKRPEESDTHTHICSILAEEMVSRGGSGGGSGAVLRGSTRFRRFLQYRNSSLLRGSTARSFPFYNIKRRNQVLCNSQTDRSLEF